MNSIRDDPTLDQKSWAFQNLIGQSPLTFNGSLITSANIQDGTVTGTDIASATITGSNIANATITGGNIANATISGGNIANATITSGNIANATITATNIANATITGTQIANATITGGNIASSTITGGNVANSTITGGNISSTTITAGNIANLTITAAQIANLTITSGKVNTSLMSYNHNIVFSVGSATQVNWASGTLTTSDGTSYSISSGNTGTMSAKTFIYLDTAVSSTALQITTTLSLAVGDGKMLIAVAQNNTNEAIFQVFNGVGGLNLAGSNIVAGSITSSEIATATITAENMVAGTITAASGIIADINADTITSGAIRAINVNASTFTTKGSYVTTTVNASDTTLNVKNTSDFPTSGSGYFFDSTNDLDGFSWTGKTSTTLTGCSGVLAHNNGATIVPFDKGITLDDSVNELRFMDSSGVLASIGLFTVGSDTVVGQFGRTNTGTTTIGVYAASDSNVALYGITGGSGNALFASSSSGNSARIDGNGTKGNVLLNDCNGSTFPSSKTTNQLASVGARLYWSDGSHYYPLNMPYFESSELTITANTNVSASHGLTDGAGNNRLPHNVKAVIRCKTTDQGWAVGDEVQIGNTSGSTNQPANGVWADTTTVGVMVSAGITVANKSTGGAANITVGNWKIVIYAS